MESDLYFTSFEDRKNILDKKKTKGKMLKLRKLWEQKRIIRHLKHNFWKIQPKKREQRSFPGNQNKEQRDVKLEGNIQLEDAFKRCTIWVGHS